MKRYIISILLFSAVCMLFSQAVMPSYWHRYENMKACMDSLSAAFPNLIKVESIGRSNAKNYDIWCAKISNNVQTRRDVPRILIIGQIHAEEVIGNEIAMKLIRDMIYQRNSEPYRTWLQNLEIFVIPSMNPEGLEVVMDGRDNTFRKNQTDNTGSGFFEFTPGVGHDIDGVDLNRNWDINWVHGDTLFSTSGYELYDYYRGAYPFSEGECIAVRDLGIREQFVYAIVWHSSRTGNLSEKIFIPYNFKELRPCPDWSVNQSIGFGVASQIPKESGIAHYEALPATGRKGDQHVWFYSKLGTIMLLAEAGTANLQPNETILWDTINRCNQGMYWLFNRALSDRPMLTGNITCAVSGEPLVAEVLLPTRTSSDLSPRLSCPDFGRFWRPLGTTTISFVVRKKGYETHTDTATISNSWRVRNVALQPLAPVTINLTVTSNGSPVNAKVTVSDPTGDCEHEVIDGFRAIQTWVGTRTITILTENGIPWRSEMVLTQSMDFAVEVPTANVIFRDDFSGDLSDNWTIVNGPWQIVTYAGRTFLTDNWGGFGMYAPGADVAIRTTAPISIPVTASTFLLFDQSLYTEWDHDFVYVSVSTDLTEWRTLYTEAGKYDEWHQLLIDLSDYAGQNIYLRFRLVDDTANNAAILDLTDPGWSIANLRVLSGNAVSEVDEYIYKPLLSLNQNFPNPFNPETTIAFSVGAISTSSVNSAHSDMSPTTSINITIYNIRGQKVRELVSDYFYPGDHSVTWNGRDDYELPVGSGVYLYRMTSAGITQTRKMVLIK
jgi:hypothetical protein